MTRPAAKIDHEALKPKVRRRDKSLSAATAGKFKTATERRDQFFDEYS